MLPELTSLGRVCTFHPQKYIPEMGLSASAGRSARATDPSLSCLTVTTGRDGGVVSANLLTLLLD